MRYRNTGAIQFTQEFGLTSYSQVLLQDGLLAGGSAVDDRLRIGNLLFQRLDFGDKLFHAVVPRNIRLAEAPSYGKTIFEHDKWSKGARAYKALAVEVVKRASL